MNNKRNIKYERKSPKKKTILSNMTKSNQNNIMNNGKIKEKLNQNNIINNGKIKEKPNQNINPNDNLNDNQSKNQNNNQNNNQCNIIDNNGKDVNSKKTEQNPIIEDKNLIKNEGQNEEEKEKNKLKINLKDLNINSIIRQTKKNDNSKTNINFRGEKKMIFKMLSNKHNTILNELKLVKENKKYINNISVKNVNTPKSIIENNINKDNLRQLNIKEKELNEKLSIIKHELNNFSIQENNHSFLKNKMNKLNNSEEKNQRILNFIAKLKKMGNEYKKMNIYLKKEEYAKELEEKEFKEIEDSKNLEQKEKEEFLSEQRLKEKSLILKRKQNTDQKIKNIMQFKNKYEKINLKKNYLYLQMENEFIENEKNRLKEIKEKKKLKILPQDIKIIGQKIDEDKNKFEERALKQKKELKKLWHSRSQALQKLKSPIFSENEIEENNFEKNKKNEKKIGDLVKNKKEYIKNNIKLPPISEILKKEMQKRLNKKINTIHSRNIININNKNNIVFYSDNNSFSNEVKINVKIKNKKQNIPRNNLKALSMQTSNGEHPKNLKYIKSKSINKIISKIPNEFNYLEEIRQKRISKENEIKKNNAINSEINDINLGSKIEAMESKYQRNKQLLKLRGGYLKNKELADNMNELLIDSIKQKLFLIENS